MSDIEITRESEKRRKNNIKSVSEEADKRSGQKAKIFVFCRLKGASPIAVLGLQSQLSVHPYWGAEDAGGESPCTVTFSLLLAKVRAQ